jgi:hypothetical protein
MTIISSSKLTEPCKWQKGYCQTENGVLSWDAGGYNPCRLVKGERTKCLFSSNRMSCPALNIAITSISTLPSCGLQVGYSKQGMIYTQQNEEEVMTNLATTDELELTVNPKKFKRESVHIPKVKLDTQLNAEFQFLYETLKDNLTFGIQMVHRETCRSHQVELEILRSLSEGGQASLMVRALLKDRRYRAKLTGDVISVYKCTEIFEYMMLQQENCTREWPVQFLFNYDLKVGWISGLSHEIMDEPTYVDCPAPSFIFDTGLVTIHLSNRSKTTNIPILPSPSEGIALTQLPDIAFSTPGIYSVEELTGQDTLLGIMKQMQRSNKIDKIINARINGQDLTPDLQQVNTVVRNMVMEPIRTLTLQIIGTSLTLLILYITCKLIHHFRFNLGRRFRWLVFLPIVGNYFLKRDHSYVIIPQRNSRGPSLPPRTSFQPEIKQSEQVTSSDSSEETSEIDLNVNTIELPTPYATAPTYPQRELHELKRLT